MVVCLLYVGLAANGYMGTLTTILFGLSIFSLYFF